MLSVILLQKKWLKVLELKQNSDYGIALTGVAGPDSLEGHPAGTVFIGIADRNQVRSIKVVIGGRSRSDVRYISTLYAFNLVRQALLQEDKLDLSLSLTIERRGK